MVFVNPNSCECTNLELDFFIVQPTQTSIEEASVVEYHPISSLANRELIDFDIPGSSNQYIDTNNIQLYMRAKIVRLTIARSQRSTSYFTACFHRSTFRSVAR